MMFFHHLIDFGHTAATERTFNNKKSKYIRHVMCIIKNVMVFISSAVGKDFWVVGPKKVFLTIQISWPKVNFTYNFWNFIYFDIYLRIFIYIMWIFIYIMQIIIKICNRYQQLINAKTSYLINPENDCNYPSIMNI